MTRTLPDPRVPVGHRGDGRPIYPVLGASSEDASNNEVQVTLSQKQLNTLMAREKDQGGRAAVRGLMERLGFSNAAALEEYVSVQRQAEEQRLTDAERREQEVAEREKAAAAREAAAVAREREATCRAVLAGFGATGADLDDAIALLRAPDDADAAVLREAAEELKSRRPELFGARPADGRVPAAPGGAPASVPPPRPSGRERDLGSAGLQMARRRGHIPPTA
ncbi:hypothetical protein J2Z21_008414 [Streptomyces griseochromogenes]|uniref:Uncharacterized protein n=1 Tax=Streptomyces griseochromogenes TaxID=68214 RepID=A0ABS4M6W9_9ACTN|nr:hypothetical protein [Streptomyces griseochromogenes]MBP2055400.1 hypothetical protein [Streptomyces griseochromogenes]